MDDDGGLRDGESLGGAGSERALNDVALSIGFAMMALLLVVVSSMTALQNLAVNLPRVEPDRPAEAPARKVPTVVVAIEADAEGKVRALSAGDAALDPAAPFGPQLEALFGEALAGADAVALRIDADGGLSHAAVSEIVFRLNAAFAVLGGAPREVTVRFAARPAG